MKIVNCLIIHLPCEQQERCFPSQWGLRLAAKIKSFAWWHLGFWISSTVDTCPFFSHFFFCVSCVIFCIFEEINSLIICSRTRLSTTVGEVKRIFCKSAAAVMKGWTETEFHWNFIFWDWKLNCHQGFASFAIWIRLRFSLLAVGFMRCLFGRWRSALGMSLVHRDDCHAQWIQSIIRPAE